MDAGVISEKPKLKSHSTFQNGMRMRSRFNPLLQPPNENDFYHPTPLVRSGRYALVNAFQKLTNSQALNNEI